MEAIVESGLAIGDDGVRMVVEMSGRGGAGESCSSVSGIFRTEAACTVQPLHGSYADVVTVAPLVIQRTDVRRPRQRGRPPGYKNRTRFVALSNGASRPATGAQVSEMTP